MRLVAEDDFTGNTLNTSLWNVLEQVHRGGVYTAGNVWVRDGNLVLQTRAENLTVDGQPFYMTSGAVNTSGLLQQRHGRFSARVRLPDVNRSPGYTLHSSIWLFANERDPHSSGCPQEIDVVEQYAGCTPPCTTSRAAGNIHPFTGGRGGPKCEKAPSHLQYTASSDFTTDWRVFTVDWLPDRLVMRIDNETVSDFYNATVMALFSDDLFFALTACVMDRVPPTAGDALPQHYLIDWVKIWQFESEYY